MNKAYFIIISGYLLLSACSAPQPFLLDGFEGVLDKNTVDYGCSDGTRLEVSAAGHEVIEGRQSLKIEYDLKSSGYMWIARGYDLDVAGAAAWTARPENIDWKRYNVFSIWMYGRNSRGVVAFDVKDSGGELWRFFLDDNFSGWKEVIMPFDHFFLRKDWQPETADNNELMDFPLKSYQFEPRVPGKGQYYFDNLRLLRVKLKK